MPNSKGIGGVMTCLPTKSDFEEKITKGATQTYFHVTCNLLKRLDPSRIASENSIVYILSKWEQTRSFANLFLLDTILWVVQWTLDRPDLQKFWSRVICLLCTKRDYCQIIRCSITTLYPRHTWFIAAVNRRAVL